ncbi:MAG: CBS domain-containing protein [Proteobacteria bacterium]|nr:CBS domain-containing protein [Pseudomonadota bacterium]
MFKFIISKILSKKDKANEDLSKIIEENREESADIPLTEKEKEILSASMKFYNTEAEEVSVPTPEIVYADVSDDFKTVIEKFKQSKRNKILVVNGSIDSVLGIVSLIDVLNFVEDTENFKLKNLVKECSFVPETLTLPKVVTNMRSHRNSIAVVVDEYGGTSGVVTVKDIVSELVGDIDEENETDIQEGLIKKISENTYELDPRLEIDELLEFLPNFSYDLKGEEEDFETVSGLILQLAKKIPDTAEEFDVSDSWKVKIIDVNHRKINKVELKNVSSTNKK